MGPSESPGPFRENPIYACWPNGSCTPCPACNGSGLQSDLSRLAKCPIAKRASRRCLFHSRPPHITSVKTTELALLLLPALAVDRNGMRLGYGGGCYDRLLSQPGWSTLPTFAVLPEACVHPTLLPAEPWDQPLDGWITEQGCSLRRASH